MSEHHDIDAASAGRSRRNRPVVLACVGVVAGMVGLSFAAVPLYDLFCRVTGYGGTTQVASEATAGVEVTEDVIAVRFDANTMPGLPWRFEPVQRRMEVRLGEQNIAYYRATNISNRPVAGSATYNVTPGQTGIFFNKIECFCFTEQTLAPGESIEMPVQFFVDPAIKDNDDAKTAGTITLSYTFFPHRTYRTSRSSESGPDSRASAVAN